MKKIFIVSVVLFLLAGTTSVAFADFFNGTVKSITNPRIRRAWSKMGPLTITGSTATPGQTDVTFSTTFDLDKDKNLATAAIEITVMDCNLKSTTKTVALKPGKDGTYAAGLSLPSSKECGLTLISAYVHVTSTEEDSLTFEALLDKAKEEGKDCKGNAKLDGVDFMTDNTSGFYVMNFSFSFDKELPSGTAMTVQVTNCKGDNANVPVKLAYNAATGTAMGSAGIAQIKDCPWTLTYGEIYSIDPCGTETDWAVDFGKVKTNGTGTRSGANTVKTSKPKLK